MLGVLKRERSIGAAHLCQAEIMGFRNIVSLHLQASLVDLQKIACLRVHNHDGVVDGIENSAIFFL